MTGGGLAFRLFLLDETCAGGGRHARQKVFVIIWFLIYVRNGRFLFWD
jgi:hypothetical protein